MGGSAATDKAGRKAIVGPGLQACRDAADIHQMNGPVTWMTMLHWIGNLCGGLLGVAVVVAWWEHAGRKANARPDDALTAPATRVVAVDVDLSAPLLPGDRTERRIALDSALVRAARRGSSGAEVPPPWLATAPMIAAALRAEVAEPPTVKPR